MRKLSIIFLSLLFAVFGYAKTASITKARILADRYFLNYSSKVNLLLRNSFSVQSNGITTFHVFNYQGGGFVVVAASDAIKPILAQSNEGFIDENFTNPAAKYWFESYSKEIARIIVSNPDNTETLKQWNNICSNENLKSATDVGPLLTTTWDQGTGYNYYCPENPYIPGAHVPVGCVATAMGQIMKYHNFPAQGVLSHSYLNENYGTQSANFGNSTYNWNAMGISANDSNYMDISLLLYHAGVSVEMDYGLSSSGSRAEYVPWALTNYFNYNPLTIGIALKADYNDIEWKELLKADLNAGCPLLYRGYESSEGVESHAWVCDGWRSGDDMFHMNWGWSGAADGWFTIGELHPSFNNFNSDNVVVKGIKPGNPDMIVRIPNIHSNQVIGYGPVVGIDCSVIKGTPDLVNLYLDNNLIYSTKQTSFTYDLATSNYSRDAHILKVEALNAVDTGYHEVTVANFGWVPQSSAFKHKLRGINNIHVVDSLVVWATAIDGENPTNPVQDFTHTKNGGKTWTSGIINNSTNANTAMIFALNADTAYCAMYMQSGSGSQGIYTTRNGGISWTRKYNDLFSNPASFPNVIHFFNKYEGFCMGDPIDGEFEIYTTDDGGYDWKRVAGENIPDPETDECGITSYYSVFNNKVWFGTTKGRVYRTSDKGLHWGVSTTSLAGKEVDVKFADQYHGLAQDKSAGTNGDFSETFDGGITWLDVPVTGQVGIYSFCFVPGTGNTWVSTNAGSAKGVFYSYDGGHSWARFAGTNADQFLAIDFASNNSGWAGSYNASSTKGGIFKFLGVFPDQEILDPVSNLFATVIEKNINLSWSVPDNNDEKRYNVFRNDTLLNSMPLINPTFTDYPVSNGMQTYCVVSVYTTGLSEPVCTDAYIPTGIPENELDVKIYPNPVKEVINIDASESFNQVLIFNPLGVQVYSHSAAGNHLSISTSGFKPGIYVLQINIGNKTDTSKISIY